MLEVGEITALPPPSARFAGTSRVYVISPLFFCARIRSIYHAHRALDPRRSYVTRLVEAAAAASSAANAIAAATAAIAADVRFAEASDEMVGSRERRSPRRDSVQLP